jgi:hypothetical protein
VFQNRSMMAISLVDCIVQDADQWCSTRLIDRDSIRRVIVQVYFSCEWDVIPLYFDSNLLLNTIRAMHVLEKKTISVDA